MKVSVLFRPRRKPDGEVEVPSGATVGDLLRACAEPADHTLAIRDGLPITEQETLREGDRLTLLSAFSGG